MTTDHHYDYENNLETDLQKMKKKEKKQKKQKKNLEIVGTKMEAEWINENR